MNRFGNLSQTISSTSASNFSEGIAIIEIGNEYLALDCDLNVLWRHSNARYRSIDPPTNGRLRAIEKGGNYGFLDAAGNELVEFRYSYALWYSDGYAIVDRDQIKSIIDRDGRNEELVDHGQPLSISDKTIFFQQGEMIEVLNLATRESFTTNLRLGPYSEGLAPFLLEGKNGFVDSRGEVVIPAAFDRVTSVKCGIFFSYSAKEKIWTMRDRSGKKISNLQIVEPGSVSENRVFVVAKRSRILLDMLGNEIWSEGGIFHLGDFSAGIARCDYDDRMDFMNSEGLVIFKKSKTEVGYSGNFSTSSQYCPVFVKLRKDMDRS